MIARNVIRLGLCRGRAGIVAVLVGLLVAAVPTVVEARELDARQKLLLADAASHQTRFQSNLKLALETAGPGEGVPAGSKARLAMARLQTAMQSAATLEARFKDLPADDAQVKQLKARFDATLADSQKLEARLTAKPETTDQPESPKKPETANQPADQPATPAPGGVKLDYRQEEAFKGATYNLSQVEGYANALDELGAKINNAADKTAIDFRSVVQGMNTITEARRKLGFANDTLAQLPANGRGVAEAVEKHKSLTARIDATEKALTPLNKQLQGTIDINNYPEFGDDRKRLNELAQMFNTTIIQSNKPAAGEVVKQADAARDERNRIMTKYADFLKQETEAGKQIAGSANHFDSNFKAFADAVGKWAQSAPQEIEADIKQVTEMAATAVADQKPAWFNGGIPQRVTFVEEKVNLYAAVDPVAAKAYIEKFETLRGQIKQEQAKLSEGIIAANELPPDRYRGEDRAALEEMAIQQWKTVEPNAQVLKICIPGAEWDRESKWRLENATWYKIDRSKLQAQLIIAKDDRLAVSRPVNLWIDHVNNDKRTATNFDDIKDDVEPRRFILREKVR